MLQETLMPLGSMVWFGQGVVTWKGLALGTALAREGKRMRTRVVEGGAWAPRLCVEEQGQEAASLAAGGLTRPPFVARECHVVGLWRRKPKVSARSFRTKGSCSSLSVEQSSP